MKLLNTEVKIENWITAIGNKKLKIECKKYNPSLIAEIKELIGAKYEGNGIWSVKNTPRNCFSLDVFSNGEFNGDSLNYAQSNHKSYYNKDFWSHQEVMLREGVEKKRFINAGEMGTGKTLPTLETLNHFAADLEGSIWWVGPNSGLTALKTQLKKWGYWNLFTSKDKIFNYHKLDQMMEQAVDPPQAVVFDECHALKNSSSRRTQLAIQLTIEMEKKWGNDCIVIGLTGTPAPENHFDWWSIAEVIRPGWLRESSFMKYKYRIAEFGTEERRDGRSYPVFFNWKNHERDDSSNHSCKNERCEVCSILPKRLKGLVLVTWKKDCLDLPEKIYEIIRLEVNESTMRVAKILTKLHSGVQLQAKLRELSDGFQYGEDGTTKGETPKDNALLEIVEEIKESSCKRIVVYAAFTASVDRCVQLLRKEGWNIWRYDGRGQEFFQNQIVPLDAITEEIFQNVEKYPQPIAFVGNPEAAGQGLTLTPAPVIVYYSNSFKSQYRIQSEDRIHRPGANKERGCKIIDLIHMPTDELVLKRLKEKRDVETITLEEILSSISVNTAIKDLQH